MRIEYAPGQFLTLPDDATEAEIQEVADQALASYERSRMTPARAAVEAGKRGAVSALQGPTFGFSDEALAALNALGGSLGQAAAGGEFNPLDQYERRRNEFRRDIRQEQRERPILSTATQVAASAPTMLIGGGAPQSLGVLPVVGRGVASGAAFGGLSGLGTSEADTLPEMAGDVATGALISGAVGGAVPALGAAGRSVRARVTKPAARSFAKEKVAEAFLRDTPGRQTVENAARRVESMSRRMPGTLAVDLGAPGPGGMSRGNVTDLMDTVANLPGKSKVAASRVIGERQATLGGKIGRAAERGLGAQGINYSDEMAARVAEKSAVAKPFYDQLRGVKFTVDDDLANILGRVDDYTTGAAKIAKLEGEAPIPVGLNVGDEISLDSLNTIKRTLFGAAEKAKREGDGTLASALTKARIALKDKIDDLSPKDEQGRSIARVADELWSGAESDRVALEAGRRAMKDDAINLADELRGMSQSEIEAWKIGAAQAIKDVAGTQAGQTKLLKQWREPQTAQKLRLIFGDNFEQFRQFIGVQARKKTLESVLGGSQTARRLANQSDLDLSAVEMAADVAQAGTTGKLTLANKAVNLLSGVRTPEPVRDEIGDILLGSPQDIPGILREMLAVQEKRARAAAGAGAFTGATLPTFTGFFQ